MRALWVGLRQRLQPVGRRLGRAWADIRQRWQVASEWLGGMLYGMFLYDAALMIRRQRGDLEHLFVLISFGDLIGVPILPPYYSLRLLPYVVPLIGNWRRRLLRERDLTDLIG